MSNDLPFEVSGALVVEALASLGIPVDNVRTVTIGVESIEVIRNRRNAEGLLTAAGHDIATETTVIGIKRK